MLQDGRSRIHRRRASFEVLERRDLLAYDVSLFDGVAEFVGDAEVDSLSLSVDWSG